MREKKKGAAAVGDYKIPEKRSCRNCGHSVWDCQAEDLTCSNPNSVHFAAWRDLNDSCMQWRDIHED